MNTVQKNALFGVIVLAIAGLALFSGEGEAVTGDAPWLAIGGFILGSLIFGLLFRRGNSAKPTPAAAKKARRPKGS